MLKTNCRRLGKRYTEKVHWAEPSQWGGSIAVVRATNSLFLRQDSIGEHVWVLVRTQSQEWGLQSPHFDPTSREYGEG